MSDETRRMLRRNFRVSGAGRRGIVYVSACFIVAYFPQVAHAVSSASAAIGG